MPSVKPLVTSPTTGLPTQVATPSNGQVLIGDGSGYNATTLTAGSNVTITNGVGTITIAASAGGGLTNWTEAAATASPNNSTAVTSFTATNALTNVDAALVAKGTGATLAQVPATSSVTNGVKRGLFATDFQKSRTLANSVALGNYSAILGGSNNNAGSNYTVVVGGQSNSAGALNAAIVGGVTNEASGESAFVGGGVLNQANGIYSAIPGGYQATTRGVTGRFSFASSAADSYGKQQMGIHVTRGQTTSNTPLPLTVDGGAVSAAAKVNALPNTSVYAIRCMVVARNNSSSVAAWEITGLVRRGLSAASTTLVGTPTVTLIGADPAAADWTVDLVVNTTVGAAIVQVTDASVTPTTVDWVSTMYTTEFDP